MPGYKTMKMLMASALALVFANITTAAPTDEWGLWNTYLDRYVQKDGRVIDYSAGKGFTTSEGQAYTLFFCLVNNDKARFQTVLSWIIKELAQGDLKTHLPAWKWGEIDNNNWGVLDSNAAADADMWLAYTLLEAGRLWDIKEYSGLGHQVLSNIVAQETTQVPKLGYMVLPGPTWFVLENREWKFNPSYLPVQQLRYFASIDKAELWQEVLKNTLDMMANTMPLGLAPDWTIYQRDAGWVLNAGESSVGSYDAIRVYLWAGMINDQDPAKKQLLAQLQGMKRFLQNAHASPPHKVNTVTGEYEAEGPASFSLALLPYLHAEAQIELLGTQKNLIKKKSKGTLLGDPPRYWDQVLGLFAVGWEEKRFRFGVEGELITAW